MKFVCQKDLLVEAVSNVSRAVCAKSPIPALEGILLKAQEGQLQLTGYDLELGSGSFIGASGDYQDLKTRSWDIIPAKSLISLYSFLRIIRALILQENRRISTLY